LDKERLHQYPKSIFGSVFYPDIEIFGTLNPVPFKGEIKNWEPHTEGWWTPEGVAEVFYPFASFMNDLEEDSWMEEDGVDESLRKSFLIPIVKVREQIGRGEWDNFSTAKVKVTSQPRITKQQARAAFDSGDYSGDVNPWEYYENRNDPTLFSTQNRLINWCNTMPNVK